MWERDIERERRKKLEKERGGIVLYNRRLIRVGWKNIFIGVLGIYDVGIC